MRRQLGGRPQRQRLLRGDGRARQRAARTRGAADRCAGRRAGPDRLDDRRRQRSCTRSTCSRATAADLRRGAPGRAGATRCRARGMRVAGALAELADAVEAGTRMVVCSRVLDHREGGRRRRAGGDGRVRAARRAQSLGALPVDVGELGCDFAAGVGPEVVVRPQWDRPCVRARRPGRRAASALARLAGARRPSRSARLAAPSDAPARHGLPGSPSGPVAHAALDVLESPASSAVQERAIELAAGLVDRLGSEGAWRRGRAARELDAVARRRRPGRGARARARGRLHAPRSAGDSGTCARRWAAGRLTRSSTVLTDIVASRATCR